MNKNVSMMMMVLFSMLLSVWSQCTHVTCCDECGDCCSSATMSGVGYGMCMYSCHEACTYARYP